MMAASWSSFNLSGPDEFLTVLIATFMEILPFNQSPFLTVPKCPDPMLFKMLKEG
jgi:hypothetical protein